MSIPCLAPIAALLLTLTACGGGSQGTTPAPGFEAGGLWVGSWSVIGATNGGPVVMESHGVGSTLSAFATLPDLPLYNEPLTGSLTGHQFSLQSQYGFQFQGWFYDGTPPRADGTFSINPPTISATWGMQRLLPSFDGEAVPIDLAGIWLVVPVSSMGKTPPSETLSLGRPQAHVLQGALQPQGGTLNQLLTGRVAGNTAWYAARPQTTSFCVRGGTFGSTSGSGVYMEFDTRFGVALSDQGTWTAVRQ